MTSEIPEEVIEDYIEAHGEPPQEGSTEHQQTSELISKKKYRKSEASPSTENSVDVTEDTNNEAPIIGAQTEAQENNRKKNKKKKRGRNEELENAEDVNEAVQKKKKRKE